MDAPPDLECTFPGQDEHAQRMRELDWSRTELGPVTAWPPSLCAAVGLCLGAPFPSALFWGPDLTLIYNAAYAPLLGPAAHPRCLGQLLRELPGSDSLRSRLLRLRQGQAVDGSPCEQFFIDHADHADHADRTQPREEVYFRFSYSPIPGPTAPSGPTVAGIFLFATEVTDYVIGARHLKALRRPDGDPAARPVQVVQAQQAPPDLQLGALHLDAASGQPIPLTATAWQRERRALLQLFLQAPLPVAVLRGPELICECVNAAWAEALERSDLQGQPLLAALPELREQGLAVLLRNVMQTGDAQVEREALVKLKRGGKLTDTYWTSIAAPLPGERGDSARIIVIGNEVTQQVQAGLQLTLLLAQAGQASRAKDEFLAILGHELRNPLAPILAALQLMRLRGASSREQEIIERQVGNLTRLVDDLLDISRISGGKIELRKQPIELAKVLAQAIELASPLLHSRSHPLEVQVAAHGLGVCVDPDRMVQTFANLLTNAAKYSEPGTPITLAARRAGDRIIAQVSDQGAGIAPDMLDKVFDLFVQQPQTLCRSRGGLGLGLTIVRSLVESHGGTVSVHSAGLGRGSVFTVELPADQALPRRAAPVAPLLPAGDRGGPQRVLVVDDNKDAATTLQLALEVLGYTVEVVGDGPQALRATAAFQPDIALIDIGLPDMDGYELARRLRAGCAHCPGLRLVAVTGYGRESDRQHAREAGFDRHLVKPVDLNALDRLLREFSAVHA